jgi:molecular chaperone GrpE
MDENAMNTGGAPGAPEPRAAEPAQPEEPAEAGGPTGAPAAEEAGEVEAVEVDAAEEAEAPAESELEAARRERDEYLELAQRARAELENYRRRVSGEATVAERRGRAAVARDLIPALDNLERALLAAGVDPDGSSEPAGEPLSQEVSAQTALAEGVALVYRELRDGLRRAGVEAFDPAGEKFDPNHHEAIATGNGGDGAKGLVLETLEKGYTLGETVLRPARVVVSE